MTMSEYSVTREQIRKLRDEAWEAADWTMGELCELALSGDEGAWEACEQAIADARAQED